MIVLPGFGIQGPCFHRAVLLGNAVFSVASLAAWLDSCGLLGSRWTFNFEGPWRHGGCAARLREGWQERAVHLSAGVGVFWNRVALSGLSGYSADLQFRRFVVSPWLHYER